MTTSQNLWDLQFPITVNNISNGVDLYIMGFLVRLKDLYLRWTWVKMWSNCKPLFSLSRCTQASQLSLLRCQWASPGPGAMARQASESLGHTQLPCSICGGFAQRAQSLPASCQLVLAGAQTIMVVTIEATNCTPLCLSFIRLNGHSGTTQRLGTKYKILLSSWVVWLPCGFKDRDLNSSPTIWWVTGPKWGTQTHTQDGISSAGYCCEHIACKQGLCKQAH